MPTHLEIVALASCQGLRNGDTKGGTCEMGRMYRYGKKRQERQPCPRSARGVSQARASLIRFAALRSFPVAKGVSIRRDGAFCPYVDIADLDRRRPPGPELQEISL